MAMKIKEYSSFPGFAQLKANSEIGIFNTTPTVGADGIGTGGVIVAAEFTKGPLNTPTQVTVATAKTTFGDFDKTIRTKPDYTLATDADLPTDWFEGNFWASVLNRAYGKLVVVRVDTALKISSTKIVFTITRSGVTDEAYTLPAGTIIADDPTSPTILAALMDDVTFTATGTTATVKTAYARGISTGVYGASLASDQLDVVLDATIDAVVYPKTTLYPNGDTSAPYTYGQTFAVTHTSGSVAAWATTVAAAYVAAIGNEGSPGGAYSVNAPARDCEFILSARHWAGGATNDCSSIRTALATHQADCRANGIRRYALIRPPFDCDLAAVELSASTDPSVAANRSKGVFYCHPPLDATIAAISTTTAIPTGVDTWLAMALSDLAPEEDPSQYHKKWDGRGISKIHTVKDTPSATAREIAPGDYTTFYGLGIAGPDYSSKFGWTLKHGITSSLTDGETFINVIRMQDYINFTCAEALEQFKATLPKPLVAQAILDKISLFLYNLKSVDNANAARIEDYSIQSYMDDGVRVVQYDVNLFQAQRAFAIFARIGEEITISAA